MLLYLFEARSITDAQRDDALRLAARRFPEVALEQRYVRHDGASQDLWVCRAPSQDRLSRWAAAAGLRIRHIRHVEAADLRTQCSTLQPKAMTPDRVRDHVHRTTRSQGEPR